MKKKILSISDTIYQAYKKDKKILVAGNGGSCSDAEHFVGELQCTYKKRTRKPLSALSLASLPAAFTAWSNDFLVMNLLKDRSKPTLKRMISYF